MHSMYHSSSLHLIAYNLEDLLSFPTRRSSDLDLTITIANSSATVVRTIESAVHHVVSSTDCASVNNFNSSFSWDGKNDASVVDRKSTRLNSSHERISYGVCSLIKNISNQTVTV